MFDFRNHLSVIAGVSAFWVALFVAYVLFLQRQPQAQPIEIVTDASMPATSTCPEIVSPTPTPSPAPLRVYVSGAVQAAGVYRLPPESLVVDAIEQAGGATENADLVAINLAHPLRDGEQIHVPEIQEDAPTPAPISRTETGVATSASHAGDDSPALASIDLNTASQEELESLPGIGPAMAQRIIEGRPYTRVDDLLQVKGIGEAKLEKLRPYVVVR